MGNPKSYSLLEVFNNVSVGFVMEFYSSREPSMMVSELSRLTAKGVMHTNNIDQTPTFSTAVLVREYEAKKPRYSLKVAQQNFHSAVPVIKEVLEWVNNKSSCTKDTRMRMSISFDNSRLKTVESISSMDVTRLIMKFDEEFIYKRFPDQRNSPYAVSIKNCARITEGIYSFNAIKRKNSIIRTPMNSYSGINFKDHSLGTLEFNYVGGLNYAEKQTEIIECLEYYVLKTYQSINEENYTREEYNELMRMTRELIESQESFTDPQKFIESYPNVKVTANLDPRLQTLRTFWPAMRKTLFEMVINNSMTKGEFNYDSDAARCQLRNTTVSGQTISNMDLVMCKVSGVVENCVMHECEVNDSRIYRSKIAANNTIKQTYMRNTTVDHNNLMEYCFVENSNETINCTVRSSVLKFAGVGSLARLDESTVIIENKPFAPKYDNGVHVEEYRDYHWLADMNKNRSDDFQNVYVKPKIMTDND